MVSAELRLAARMAGRGKLIAVIGDEDTVTGFLLGGIGELNKNRHPNFLVVEKDTPINEIEDTFRYGSPQGLSETLCCGGAGGRRGRRGDRAGGPALGLPTLTEGSDPNLEGQRSRSARRSGAEVSAPQVPFLGLGRAEAASGPRVPPHMTVCQERRGTELVMGAAPRLRLPAVAGRPEHPASGEDQSRRLFRGSPSSSIEQAPGTANTRLFAS